MASHYIAPVVKGFLLFTATNMDCKPAFLDDYKDHVTPLGRLLTEN